MFRQDFTCPALLKDSWALSHTGLSPISPDFPDRFATYPRTTGLFRVRSPLLAESLLMSFPPGTEMFQFPGFASMHYVFMHRSPCGGVAPFGYPRIKACSRLPMAFRSVPRPSSPPDAKASTECSYRAQYHNRSSLNHRLRHAQKQTIHQHQTHIIQSTDEPRRRRGRFGTCLSPTQHIHNASERISPRSRRQMYRYTCTSGQTWLTAARPETHQNLIHIANEHSTRTTLDAAQSTEQQQSSPPRNGEQDLRRTETSPWFTSMIQAPDPHHAKGGADYGGDYRDRTDDLLLAKQALSQLS
jgi:hypothetical protein